MPRGRGPRSASRCRLEPCQRRCRRRPRTRRWRCAAARSWWSMMSPAWPRAGAAVAARYTVDTVADGRQALARLETPMTASCATCACRNWMASSLYRLLERQQPHLCQRLIFLTGIRWSPPHKRSWSRAAHRVSRSPFPSLRRAVPSSASCWPWHRPPGHGAASRRPRRVLTGHKHGRHPPTPAGVDPALPSLPLSVTVRRSRRAQECDGASLSPVQRPRQRAGSWFRETVCRRSAGQWATPVA